ncbi:hypothetical protein [Geodermatophilus sp. URMC 64]
MSTLGADSKTLSSNNVAMVPRHPPGGCGAWPRPGALQVTATLRGKRHAA